MADPLSSSPTPRLALSGQLALSSYWLAYNFQWAALLAIVLPSQIAEIAGESRKEIATGFVTAAGAMLSLVLTPVAGAISDRSRSRFGRRRPYVLVGTIATIAFLLAMGSLRSGASLALYVLFYLGLQIGSNGAGGPYAALIPDLVPAPQRGAASGWMAIMTTVGTLAGVLAAGAMTHPGHYLPTAIAMSALLVVATAVTLAGVRETPRTREAVDVAWSDLVRGFLPDARIHRDFYWVLGTRALVGMGIYSVFSFFQYFLADLLRVPDPERQASYLIGVIIAAGLPTSLIAGVLSDRTGRKPLVYASGGIMAVASLAFIAAGASSSIAAIFGVAALFGVGYGAYQAVDWALAVDVLPPGDNAAKDMGLWHVSLVLPQVVAPALSGALLAVLKPISLLTGYVTVFAVTAIWFVLGTVLVAKIRSAR
jgi:Na+/melibiose symporter-like transporter